MVDLDLSDGDYSTYELPYTFWQRIGMIFGKHYPKRYLCVDSKGRQKIIN